MKNKSWIIIIIMGIALTISLVYSIIVSKKANSTQSSHTVTTTSIIEMTATTATIKNTLTGVGKVEFKELKEEQENLENEQNLENQFNEDTNQINIQETASDQELSEEEKKFYQIILSISDKDLDKVKREQKVEITINKDAQALNYIGKVKQIDRKANDQSTITIVIDNVNEELQENQEAVCTVIVEEAENVVALPIEAIQHKEEKTYVQKVKDDGTTEDIAIKTGLSDDYYVEITEGLEAGDRVQIIKSTTTITSDKKNETKAE